jgi:hypothetical protein
MPPKAKGLLPHDHCVVAQERSDLLRRCLALCPLETRAWDVNRIRDARTLLHVEAEDETIRVVYELGKRGEQVVLETPADTEALRIVATCRGRIDRETENECLNPSYAEPVLAPQDFPKV